MRSLPNLIDKYPDESLEGFLCRFALVNHREVKDLELGYLRSDASEENINKYLASISILTGQDISKDFLFPFKWYLKGLTLPEWKNHYYTRFCPNCIKEKTYHRTIWSLSHHTSCIKHLIYLIENCYYCHKKIKIEDVTKGRCGTCHCLLKHTPVVDVNNEKEYVTEDGGFKEIGCLYLRHSLNETEQIYLTRWLSYYLVDRTKLFNLNLNSTEKQRLAKGYYHEIVLQRRFLSLAHDLLSAWPSKLVLFLRIHFNGSYDKVKEFMFKFVYSMPYENIKKLLWKVHERERGYKDIRFEHQYYDHNFLLIEDLLEINNIPEEILHRIIKKNKLEFIKHPRNNLNIINSECIPLIQNQVRNYSGKINFISVGAVAKRWNVSIKTAKLICEMFEVPSRSILESVCFKLSELEVLDQKATQYIAVQDLLDKSIWSKDTLIEYLSRRNIEIVFRSRINRWEYLYLREDAMNAFNVLSNNKSDYLTRREVINQLGKELFKAGQLDVYYSSGGKTDAPHFLKFDVNHVISMFEKHENIKEVFKIRNKEIFMRNMIKK
ncbi:TniQ family protein [Paenibacillus roseipurpureus]|uniref:TniQ family protein n=1 Tax=Paenibacillus roseopurpureus TaxID=2918901 RepID=A0AA96RIQ3_9BACL|nr:TniQ family protein [Paenibacillus sp. MBLB1832]WNR43055.1 TniQ family protein [Paenibacillus sp. MBLB1832]